MGAEVRPRGYLDFTAKVGSAGPGPADPTGQAVHPFTIPTVAPDGQRIRFQAGWVPSGAVQQMRASEMLVDRVQ